MDMTTMNNVSNNVTQIVQTVRQANWRVQRQWIGLFLLVLVLVAMVAGIYLNITVRATLAGREIQMLQADITTNTRANSDLETQLASLSSVEAMNKRAEAMGYNSADSTDITYVFVPGYTPQRVVNLSAPKIETVQPLYLLPAYTESLFDWLTRTLAESVSAGGRP
jgi:cell division protein FtsL